MIKRFVFFLFFLSTTCFSKAQNIDSLSHINYQTLHGANLNDVWGYVDELGNEYAIVGTSKGTSIVNISNPTNPVEVFWLPGSESIWRDPCVYGDYAYITTEAEDGLQIIDLSPLPQSNVLPSVIYAGPSNNPWQSAHTCFVDENGFAYIFGANRGNGGVIILDVNTNPMSPVEVGTFDNWYVHDGFVRNDTMYLAHIYDGFFSLVDVSNKANPILLGTNTTPNNFTHNIWPSSNGQFVFTTDEVSGAYITAYNIENPTNCYEVDRIQNSPGEWVIPHNTHVMGDYLITSYYSDGITIHDVTYPDNIIKVGGFDTYPGQTPGFDGCWGVYPFLPSGTIIAADITQGLFILSPTYQKACYLIGNVSDQSNGTNLSGVRVQINDNDQFELTSSFGNYKTGILNPGTYMISYTKAGYYPKTESVQLFQNQEVVLNIELIPIPPFEVTFQVKDAQSGNPISDAKIKLVHPLIQHDGISNGIGEENFTLYYQENYEVFIGKWGYDYYCLSQQINENMQIIVIELNKGYSDNFDFDLGWSSTGTAVTGKWERGIPNTTDSGSQIGEDDDWDCGKNAFVTGNTLTINPDVDDVDKGTAVLVSPQMDLTSYSSPHINYSRGFYCFYGPGEIDDSLKVYLSNGTESILIDVVAPPQSNAMIWNRVSIPISGLITINSSMQLFIKISDEDPDKNITEAAFDRFSVSNVSLAEVTEQKNEYVIFPNPFQDELKVTNVEIGDILILFDPNGRILFQKIVDNSDEIISVKFIQKGPYFLKIANHVYKVIKG
jgi:choice-of-anchor B domain-containing protein